MNKMILLAGMVIFTSGCVHDESESGNSVTMPVLELPSTAEASVTPTPTPEATPEPSPEPTPQSKPAPQPTPDPCRTNPWVEIDGTRLCRRYPVTCPDIETTKCYECKRVQCSWKETNTCEETIRHSDEVQWFEVACP